MRIVLINPWDRTVTERETFGWDSGVIYSHLSHYGSNPVDDFNVVQLATHVSLYVDGEGFLKPDQPVWYIIGHSRSARLLPLYGMGILIGGVDETGRDRGLPEYISEKFCQDAVT